MLLAVALREYVIVVGFVAPGRIGKPGLNCKTGISISIGESKFTH